MSTAGIAVVVMGACSLATTGGALWVALRVADRLRLAAPARPVAERAAEKTEVTEGKQ